MTFDLEAVRTLADKALREHLPPHQAERFWPASAKSLARSALALVEEVERLRGWIAWRKAWTGAPEFHYPLVHKSGRVWHEEMLAGDEPPGGVEPWKSVYARERE